MKMSIRKPQRGLRIPIMNALANKVLNEIGLSRIIDECVNWEPRQWFISPGILTKAMVFSTIDSIRTPLYKIERLFQNLDGGFLLGPGIYTPPVVKTRWGASYSLRSSKLSTYYLGLLECQHCFIAIDHRVYWYITEG